MLAKEERLVIGSAGKPCSEAITVDIDPLHNPDVVHDLRVIPWPFRDDQFREIIAHHVIEHLDSLLTVFPELHRVCHKDGQIYIEVPHHTCWYAYDPEHKLFFSYFSLDGHIAGNDTWVTGKKFICVKREITFHKYHRMFFYTNYLIGFRELTKDFFATSFLQKILNFI